MGAKKKNKANKLARMSEEERMRYLQHRAAIEEEAKRRKEQLISTFLKNKLKREQIFSRLNVAKINQQWRYILRQIKCQELKQELRDLKKWFDYTLDKKNESIKMVLTDLDEAENQYLKIHWIHTEAIDRLIGIYHQRIDHFRRLYESERDDIYKKAIEQIADINAAYTEDNEQLEAAIFRTEENFDKSTSSMTSRHFYKMDELRNNMLTDFENLKNSRELQIEKIWQELEAILKEYWKQTEDRKRQYLIIRDTDRENCKQIFDNNEQINGVIDSIESLKNHLAKVTADGNQEIKIRKEDREKAQQVFHRLKKEVVNEMSADKKNLNFMNNLAGKTTEELKTILAKGKQILKLHNLCKNLQFQNELKQETKKKPHLTEEEEKQIEEQMQKFVEPLAEKVSRSVVIMNQFWARFNEVFLEKEALVLYIQALLDEKKYLKAILRSYFSKFVVKQPESKVSYAKGVRFRQQRPATTIPFSKRNPVRVASPLQLEDYDSPVKTLSIRIGKPAITIKSK